MRTILFTGKGGVGKTTVAAATAVRVAQRGARTLVMSTDSAHSLGDSFGVTLGDRPVEVAPGCRAAEPDAQRRLERSWGDIRGYLREVMEWAGVDSIEADELSLLPGVEEVVALTEIAAIRRRGDVDVLVVDCAPTAETIRLLSLPDVLAWYMARVFPAGRRLSRALGPVVSRVARVPIADDAVFASVERLYADLSAVRDILRDHRRSSARLVVNPEKMVVAEARRTATYLSLFGYRVDAVVANRVLPDALTDPWFDGTPGDDLHLVRPGTGVARRACRWRDRGARCARSVRRLVVRRSRSECRPGNGRPAAGSVGARSADPRG